MVIRLLRERESLHGRAFDRWLTGYRHRLDASQKNSE
jgi:hypothetical protein